MQPPTGRIVDALLGLADGDIVIGGPDAHGLFDNPVVMWLYDKRFIDTWQGKWRLTPLGVSAAWDVREALGVLQ